MKSDSELLQHWATSRDEAAFAELVTRHAGLVLGTTFPKQAALRANMVNTL